MSFNYVLIWLVIGSSVMTIIRIARAAHTNQHGWIVVSALVIIVTAVMIFLRPDIAGYAGGGLWFALALLPSLLGRFAIRATLQQNYAIARNLGMIVRFLHPADGWERQPQLMGALGLAQDGKIAESSEILSRLRTAQNVVGRTAALQFFRMSGQWEECLAWIQQTPIAARGEFGFVMNHLRALGETGELNGMLAEFERAEK